MSGRMGAGGLSLHGVTAGYGRVPAIADVCAHELPAGSLTAVLGPNGSGKSTLLKTVAGLLPPKAGEVRLDGRDLGRLDLAERAALVAYLPQALPPAVHLRVFESVLVAANALGGPARSRVGPEAVQAVLADLGIAGLAMRHLDALSGGQKQLVGLAQALARRPRVLLLDEPLSALDLNHQYQVLALLRRMTRERGLVTVVVVHDVNVALRHADAVMLMRAGRLLGHGAPPEVVTPGALADVYGVVARVESCSRGQPYVVVDDVVPPGV